MMTLEEIKTFCGTPTAVDGVGLDEAQANFLARTVSRLVGEAEHPFDTAVQLSLQAFRSSFELDGDRWRTRREIQLPGGKVIRHCFEQENGG